MNKLRFDVETLIIATSTAAITAAMRLRFDVETLIIATVVHRRGILFQLRFDVETLIIATGMVGCSLKPCCDN